LKLVITGSIAFDYLMSFPGIFSHHFLPDKLDHISVSFLVDSLKKQRGGVAANIAYSLALLGEKPLLFGTVGKDFGPYREELESVGVDTSGVKAFDDEYTASCFINTDQDGSQIVSFYTGAMRFAKDHALNHAIEEGEALVVVSPNDPAAMADHPAACRRLGIPFVYDPSQQIARLDGNALKTGLEGAKMLILNDYELGMFKKKTGLDDTGLMEHVETVVVTHGDQGSEIRTQDETIAVPIASPERILDPTGVGDAFRSGLLKGVMHGLPWDVAGRMGSLAAAYVLETDGPQSHSYNINAFVERYGRVFGESEHLERLTI
jgi:adenosine kinase